MLISKKKRHRLGELLHASVNSTTTKLSPVPPLMAIGHVFQRVLAFMLAVPAHELIYWSKIDLSDGFWRMIVGDQDSWNFAYVLPQPPGSPIILVRPHALQMGWAESPGYFCAATETGRDVLQAVVDSNTHIPPHPLEHFICPIVAAPRQPQGAPIWQLSAVYVDDYIIGAVEDSTGSLLLRTARASLHAIHSIFPPPARSGHTGGKDPVSQKKLDKGDGRFCPQKEILGFLVDGRTRTVCLPQRKVATLISDLDLLLRGCKASLKCFRSLAGKLRHAAQILPAAKSLFTVINRSLRGTPAFIPLPLKGELRCALLDLRCLILDLANRPTHVLELINPSHHYIGYCDASGWGAGGVWFSGTRPLPPTVWRVQWPSDVSKALVSDANPKGYLTNSDLEMAGVLLHQLVLAHLVPLHHVRSIIHCDNSPSVSWVTNMSLRSASSNSAHRLLRGLAMLQRHTHSSPPCLVSIAGVDNILADVASRQISLPSDSQFLTYFSARFPFVHAAWQQAYPLPTPLSNVISTLRGKRLDLPQWTQSLGLPAGAPGSNTPPPSTLTHGSPIAPESSSNSSFWALPPGLALDALAQNGKLDTKPSKKPSVMWHKPSFWLDAPTPAGPCTVAPTWTCPSPASSNTIATTTRPPAHSLPFPSSRCEPLPTLPSYPLTL